MSTQATTSNGVAAISNNDDAASTYNDFDEGDAAASFLSKWSDEDNESSSQASAEDDEEESTDSEQEEQSEDEADEDQEETEESETDPDEDADEESAEGEDEQEKSKDPKKVLEDDAVVKLKVDDQELEVSVKDLKRLYGQEKALTRKSQEVASKRKEAEDAGIKLAASLDKLYKNAEERWKPYAEIDWLVASKELDAETLSAVRKEAQAAWDNFQFISEEANSFVTTAKTERQKSIQAAAAEAVKVLKEDIPGWSPQLYDSIRSYAIDSGMDAEVVNNMVDPVAIKLLHKARLYDESKKIVTKKKVLTPKKVIKTTNAVPANDSKNERVAKAQQRSRNSGAVDDAASLFMSRWESDE